MQDFGQLAIQIIRILEPLYKHFGYLFVILGSFFENTLFFGWALPGGIITALGGFYSRNTDPLLAIAGQRRHLSLFWVIIISILGATLGKVMDYWIGYFAGKKIVKIFHLEKQEELAKHFIKKHGVKAFFLTSIAGPLRSILMLTAGIIRTPFDWFFGVVFITSIIWGAAFVLLGYFLGQNRKQLEAAISYLGFFGWILIMLWIGFKVYQKIKPSYPPDKVHIDKTKSAT